MSIGHYMQKLTHKLSQRAEMHANCSSYTYAMVDVATTAGVRVEN